MTVSEIIKETVEKYKLHHLDYADFWYERDGILFMAEEIRNIGTITWTCPLSRYTGKLGG